MLFLAKKSKLGDQRLGLLVKVVLYLVLVVNLNY
jgi:hypothetical protein